MSKRRSFMIHFEITPACMEAGLCRPGTGEMAHDVLFVLAEKLRSHPDVRAMLEIRDPNGHIYVLDRTLLQQRPPVTGEGVSAVRFGSFREGCVRLSAKSMMIYRECGKSTERYAGHDFMQQAKQDLG